MNGVPVSLIQVLRRAVESHLSEVHTVLPGRIVAYRSDTQRADVELLVKHAVWDHDDGREYETFPTLTDIPVQWPRGGGYVLTFPLAAGDNVAVFFAEAGLAEWRTTGQLSEPHDARRMSIGWPFCMPGLYPDVSPMAAGDNTARQAGVVLGKDGAEPQLRISATEIKLGATAADYVALSAKVDAIFATLKAAFNSHKHAALGAVPTPDPTNKIPLYDGSSGDAPSSAAAITKAK